ncbi:hypothetical protein [Pseudooceanicola sp. LIPI14-2-Ac024]|uniref:hypothetical protein n=1 Tax=Pseudooceanicola sp. LIPI14-2-Ac024 TaxID=3344875 RepID=UPI0035D0D10D
MSVVTISYLHIPEESLLLVRIAGHVSRAENAQALRRMGREGVFLNIDRLLIDVTEFTGSDMSTSDMHWLVSEIAHQIRHLKMDMRVSICALPDSFGFAMARVFHSFAVLTDGLEMVALHEVAEALRWLDLNADQHVYVERLHAEATVVG